PSLGTEKTLRISKTLWKSGIRDMAIERLARETGKYDRSCCDEPIQVDTRFKTHGLQHEYQIFRHDIASRTRCIRASSKACLERIKCRHTHLERCHSIGQPLPSCIEKVGATCLVAELSVKTGKQT